MDIMKREKYDAHELKKVCVCAHTHTDLNAHDTYNE